MPHSRLALLGLVASLLGVASAFACAPDTQGRVGISCPEDARPETRRLDDGLLHACVDADGLDHGPQHARSDRGELLFEGHFIHGEPHGIASILSPPGETCCSWQYEFDHGRPLWRRGRGLDGRLFAEWIYDEAGGATVRRWHANGVQSDAFEMANGELEGRWLRWWPDGELLAESNWRGGQLEGDFREWYPDGQPKLEGRYVDGRRTGEWSFWSEDGELVDRRRHSAELPAAPR
jgi:hypothetical protein